MLKHTEELTQGFIDNLEVGEYFTYTATEEYDGKIHYRKGLKISPKYMIPIGGRCDTPEGAIKTY